MPNLPFAFTKSIERGEAPKLSQSMPAEHRREFEELTQKYFDAGACHVVEDTIRECITGLSKAKRDSERTYSQSLYVGFIKAAAQLHAQFRAAVHFQADRQRETDSRLKALEDFIRDNPPFQDKGVWHSGNLYRKNSFVSHDGSGWIAQRDTNNRPGAGDDWRLAIKRGRDAR